MNKKNDTLIENTVIEARTNAKGEIFSYIISPCEGYKLHAKHLDEPVFDENGNETGEIKKVYTKAFTTVQANYDFKENPFEIYAEKDE